MVNVVSRRNWFKSVGAATAGLAISPALLRGQAHAPDPEPAEVPNQGPIRLSGNENPYGPGPLAMRAIRQSADQGNRYAFRQAMALKEKLAAKEGVSPEQIVLGTGSGEVLCMAGLKYGLEARRVLTASPTYLQMLRYMERIGSTVKSVSLNDKLEYDLDALKDGMDPSIGLVYICNPNNPTGTMPKASELRAFLKSLPDNVVAFVDEAYLEMADDFEGNTMIDLVHEGRNVIVARTFSKVHGLAGMRVGYGVCQPETAKELNQYGMGSPNPISMNAASASLDDKGFLAFCTQRMKEGRENIYAMCKEKGMEYAVGHGSFVFFQTGKPIAQLQAKMAERGVLIGRPFPPLLDWCRLTIGKPEEMEIFRNVFDEVLADWA